MDRSIDGKNTIKSALMYTISNCIGMIVSIITIPILSNIMSTSDMGLSTSFMTTMGILGLIATFSIADSQNRAMLEFKNNQDEYISTIYIFSVLSTFFFMVVYFCFKSYFNKLLGFSTNLMLLMFVIQIFLYGYTYMLSKWNFNNKYIRNFVLSMLSSPCAQILSIILVLLFNNNKYLGRIIGTQIFMVIMGIIFGITILIHGKFIFKKEFLKYGLKISVPMIPHSLSQTLLSNCDLLMIKSMIGASQAGIYGMAYTISGVLYSVLLQILKPWSPWVYRRLENEEYDSIKNNSNILVTFCFISCVGLFTIAPDLIKIFFNESYIPSTLLIAPITVGLFFRVIYVLFYDIEYYFKKTKYIAFWSIITCILNVILNVIFINKFGYKAAAYTTLISYFILALFNFAGMIKISKKNYYDSKYILCVSFILFIMQLLSVNFINNFLIRYGILFIAIIFSILKQYKNFALFKSMLISLFKKNSS